MSVLDVPFWDYGEGPYKQDSTLVLMLSDAPDPQLIVERARQLVALAPPLSRRVVESPGKILRPFLVDDPDFAVESHFTHIRLPGLGTREQFLDFLSRRHQAPLDRYRPPWEYWLVENVEGGAALVLRSNHCIGDGLSAMDAMKTITDQADSPEKLRANMETQRRRLEKQVASQREERQAVHLRDELERLRSGVREVMAKLSKREAPLYGPELSIRRQLDWWTTPIANLRSVQKATGAPLVAVYQTLLSMAVEATHPDPPPELPVALPITVSHLLPQEYPINLTSRQVSTILRLPIGMADPAERLRVTQERLKAVEFERDMFLMSVKIGRYLPRQLLKFATRRKIGNSCQIASYIPGPLWPWTLDGIPITDLEAFTMLVPHNPYGIVGMNYGDRFGVSVVHDPTVVPWAANLPKAFGEACEHLVASTVGNAPGTH